MLLVGMGRGYGGTVGGKGAKQEDRPPVPSRNGTGGRALLAKSWHTVGAALTDQQGEQLALRAASSPCHQPYTPTLIIGHWIPPLLVRGQLASRDPASSRTHQYCVRRQKIWDNLPIFKKKSGHLQEGLNTGLPFKNGTSGHPE
ncbi:hypothetical protein UY3_01687 [Chelonia mydas]|uniref:Uncharacterized protein n=1 Tax=Chelonia mydas TaxID=8469 RepID=M7C8Y1_CHEMY|nr:hypothetical protein UY3_01687 [Chelonia mydas]